MSGPVDVLAVLEYHAIGLRDAPRLTRTQAGRVADELTKVHAAVGELVKRGAVMLPHGVCLTNPNVPDSLEVPLLATMGELRAFAAALANVGGAA